MFDHILKGSNLLSAELGAEIRAQAYRVNLEIHPVQGLVENRNAQAITSASAKVQSLTHARLH
jgi:hypothetical protein